MPLLELVDMSPEQKGAVFSTALTRLKTTAAVPVGLLPLLELPDMPDEQKGKAFAAVQACLKTNTEVPECLLLEVTDISSEQKGLAFAAALARLKTTTAVPTCLIALVDENILTSSCRQALFEIFLESFTSGRHPPKSFWHFVFGLNITDVQSSQAVCALNAGLYLCCAKKWSYGRPCLWS
jgi:hypothetical protein